MALAMGSWLSTRAPSSSPSVRLPLRENERDLVRLGVRANFCSELQSAAEGDAKQSASTPSARNLLEVSLEPPPSPVLVLFTPSLALLPPLLLLLPPLLLLLPPLLARFFLEKDMLRLMVPIRILFLRSPGESLSVVTKTSPSHGLVSKQVSRRDLHRLKATEVNTRITTIPGGPANLAWISYLTGSP
mmetsp:Transcript_4559/g.7678  ORF Transcript_4559/g.7678 Transcript_4559/m.7678 type:complete len:188 (+) Transcript_4559:383-946(+)